MQPQRIQRKREKDWRMPAGTLYVGGPGPFGNPFRSAKAFHVWLTTGEVRVEELRDPATTLIPEQAEGLGTRRNWILSHLPQIAGKDLDYWCRVGQPCHADLLLKRVQPHSTDSIASNASAVFDASIRD